MKFKLKDNLTSRLAILLICTLTIAFREIDLLRFPRFWAEEALIFYNYALCHSTFEVFITPQVGYLTLFNSIVSTIQVKFISADAAPVFTTYSGFLIQLVPAMIIVFSSHVFWNSIFKKFVCSITIIVVTAPELMLNTTNSHFIFGLITFLIMVIPAKELSGIMKYLFRFLLIIGTLTGPASMFLAPVFFYKAYHEKNREKYLQATIILVCSLLQAIVLIHTILYNNTYQRLEKSDINLTVNAFFTDNFSLNMNRVFFGILMAGFYVYLFIKNRKSREHLIFLFSFIIVAVFSTLGSLDMQGSPRYAYVPTCILMLLISSEAFEIRLSKLNFRYVFSGLIFVSCLALSFVCYQYRMYTVYSKNFPIWKEEVARFRLDNKYRPRVHPGYMYVQF
jgi:hypothetical protein